MIEVQESESEEFPLRPLSRILEPELFKRFCPLTVKLLNLGMSGRPCRVWELMGLEEQPVTYLRQCFPSLEKRGKYLWYHRRGEGQ